MAHLFSPITIGRKRLLNRIVMAPTISGFARPDGFLSDSLLEYYERRAEGGVGLVIMEPAHILRPDPHQPYPHLGLYADAFVPHLRGLAYALHAHNTQLFVMLDAPAASFQPACMPYLPEHFALAAWRALAAGCDGIILSTADGGVWHRAISPTNRREGTQHTLTERLQLLLSTVEQTRTWLGSRLIIGMRLIAEEFTPEGIQLHDARVMAKHLVAAGVDLLDITVAVGPNTHVARFPGWTVPLAESIKWMVPQVPVITSGLLGDPILADSVIREGSADLIMLGYTLHENPDWPQTARTTLTPPTKSALEN